MLNAFTEDLLHDPLRDDKLGPPALPHHDRTGKAIGRGLDSLTTAALMAGLPVLGGAAGYALTGGNPLAAAAGVGMGGVGSLGLMAARPLLAAMPLSGSRGMGARLGERVGRFLDSRAPRENHMVERIHDMTPNQGLAYIQTLERQGSEPPHVIQAMKDAYNTRRIGVQEQLKVSATGFPTDNSFQDPLDYDTAPQGLTNLHRPMKRWGGVLGSLASVALPAVAGGMAEHSLFGTSGAVGAGLGALSGIPLTPIGHSVGRTLGRHVGTALEGLQSESAHAVEKIKTMNPGDAYVHIRALERAGKTHPDTLRKMKEAFNFRRDGLAYQAQAGVGDGL